MTNILQLAESGNAANVMRDMRVRSLYSPYFFEKVVLGYRDLVDHLHLHDTELFVTRWSDGVTKQFIEWPRAFFKTTTFTIGVSIWHVLPVSEEDHLYALDTLQIPEEAWLRRVALHDQDATQLIAFETDENAKKKIGQIKWHFEENELFRTLFPEIAFTGKEPKWSNDCLTIRRVGERRRDAEGTFEAIGVGGALQSRHYKTVWEDDLVGERARKSQAEMDKVIGWHGRLHGAFEDASKAIRFGVSNRWGYNDLNSYIRKNEPDVVFYTRAAWEVGEDGVEIPIFPERYSIEALMKIRDSGSMTRYDFSCQYLNSPVLPGDQQVDLSNRHYYTVAEDGAMHCSCGGTYYPSQLLRYLHYDPYNAKATSTSCPAIVGVGTSSDEHVFVLSIWTTRGTYDKVYDQIFTQNDRYRPGLFTYEDVGHQNSVEYHWKTLSKTTEYKAEHRNPPTIQGVKTGNRNKETRIRESLFPVIENRKFSTRRNMLGLDRQLETFPNKTLDHDYDILDALAQGAMVWKFPDSDDTRLVAAAEEKEYLAKLGTPYGHSMAGAL